MGISIDWSSSFGVSRRNHGRAITTRRRRNRFKSELPVKYTLCFGRRVAYCRHGFSVKRDMQWSIDHISLHSCSKKKDIICNAGI